MNILFHIATGAAIIILHSHIKHPNKTRFYGSGFILGVISHGILDYTPHCYPIPSKIDAILGLLIMISTLFFVKKKFKILVSAIFFGCVFPDLIDLSPGILNTLFHINLPIFDKVFPWHYHQYSGSIYSTDCTVSMANHGLVLMFCSIIIFLKLGFIKKNILRTDKSNQ